MTITRAFVDTNSCLLARRCYWVWNLHKKRLGAFICWRLSRLRREEQLQDRMVAWLHKPFSTDDVYSANRSVFLDSTEALLARSFCNYDLTLDARGDRSHLPSTAWRLLLLRWSAPSIMVSVHSSNATTLRSADQPSEPSFFSFLFIMFAMHIQRWHLKK